jgi:NADPH:quinone reductase-like Zn-dependent oxidoreductase
MQQAWITKGGPPDVFELRETSAPVPDAGEVLIDVEAIGVNFADLLMRRGVYAAAPDLPAVPGYEAAGTVRAVGDDVERLAKGDAVMALVNVGGYATQLAVPARQAWKRPEGMSAEEGAALPVNYLTAFEAMVVMGSLRRPDELGGQPTRVLVHGAAGGVGIAAVQIGQIYDAELFGTASPWKHDFAREQGYDHLIDYRTDDFVEVVQNLTDGRGVDLVLDPIGGRHWKRSLDVLAPTGRLCVFGMADAVSGPLSALKMLFRTPWWRFTPPYLMTRSVGVFGYFLGATMPLADETRDWFEVLLRRYDEGALQPHIHETFPLAEAGEAHAHVEARKSVGKVLLKP